MQLVAYDTVAYNSTTSGRTTGTFTWAAGDVIVIVALNESDGANFDVTAAIGGTGLALTAGPVVGVTSGTGTVCLGRLYTGTATAAGSGVITATRGTNASNHGLSAWLYRGARLGTPVSNGTATKTISLTTTAAGSTVLFSAGDFSAGAAPSVWTPAGFNSRTSLNVGTSYTVSVGEWANQNPATTSYGVTTGFGAGTVTKFAIEVIDVVNVAPIRGRSPSIRTPQGFSARGRAFHMLGSMVTAVLDPLNLAVTPTAGTTATLTWDAAVLAGVTDYSVFSRTPPTGVPFVPGVDTPTASSVAALTYAATGLTGSTSYEWQVFGRVPGTFSPASLPSLVALYDASVTSSITASSGAVSQWNDLASVGPYHLTQATGSAQPATGNTLNGQNVIRFDGTNDEMNASTLAVSQPFTIFAVYKLNDATKGRVFDSNSRVLYNPTVGASSPHGIYAGASANVASTQDTNPVCHLAVFNGATSSVQINSTLTTGLNPSTTNLSWLQPGAAGVGAPSAVDWAVLAICSGDQSASFSTFLAYSQSFWGTP